MVSAQAAKRVVFSVVFVLFGSQLLASQACLNAIKGPVETSSEGHQARLRSLLRHTFFTRNMELARLAPLTEDRVVDGVKVQKSDDFFMKSVELEGETLFIAAHLTSSGDLLLDLKTQTDRKPPLRHPELRGREGLIEIMEHFGDRVERVIAYFTTWPSKMNDEELKSDLLVQFENYRQGGYSEIESAMLLWGVNIYRDYGFGAPEIVTLIREDSFGFEPGYSELMISYEKGQKKVPGPRGWRLLNRLWN